jgi:uncharacterized protein YjlB
MSVKRHAKPLQILNSPEIIARVLDDDGRFPNNARLPLLIYRHALNLPRHDPASAIEDLLEENDWCNSWRDGIYTYHHYHSNTHEVLVVFSGSSEVQFGGPEGVSQEIAIGDVVIIPAGVAHKNLGSNDNFGVIGAYPEGRDWDICRGRKGERPAADERIARIPIPRGDPIYGPDGPLAAFWRGTEPRV